MLFFIKIDVLKVYTLKAEKFKKDSIYRSKIKVIGLPKEKLLPRREIKFPSDANFHRCFSPLFKRLKQR